MRNIAQLNAFQNVYFMGNNCFRQFNITTKKTLLFNSEKIFPYKYQFIWNTLDQNCCENFSTKSTEQELVPFLTQNGKIQPKYLNFIQSNIDISSIGVFT